MWFIIFSFLSIIKKQILLTYVQATVESGWHVENLKWLRLIVVYPVEERPCNKLNK